MKKKAVIIVSIILVVMAIIGFTLALIYYRSDTTSVNLKFESNLGAFINYQSGNPVLGSEGTILNSGSDYTSGTSTEIEFWKTEAAHNMDIYGHIFLDITSASSELLNMEGLKWAVTSNDILISEGNFVGYSEGGSIPILVNQKLISSLTTFKIYVWIDENNLGTVAGENEAFSVSVRCEATSGEYEIFDGTTIRILERKTITYGNSYDFKENISSELPNEYIVVSSTYDNASTLNKGEYQIRYIIKDNNGNKYTYYQKVEIV